MADIVDVTINTDGSVSLDNILQAEIARVEEQIQDGGPVEIVDEEPKKKDQLLSDLDIKSDLLSVEIERMAARLAGEAVQPTAIGAIDADDRITTLEQIVGMEEVSVETTEELFKEWGYDTELSLYQPTASVLHGVDVYYKRNCSFEIDPDYGVGQLYGMYEPHITGSPEVGEPTAWGDGEDQYLVAARVKRGADAGYQQGRVDLAWLNLENVSYNAMVFHAHYADYAGYAYDAGYATYGGYAYGTVPGYEEHHDKLNFLYSEDVDPNPVYKEYNFDHDKRYPVLGSDHEDAFFYGIGYGDNTKTYTVTPANRINLGPRELVNGPWYCKNANFHLDANQAFRVGGNTGQDLSTWFKGGVFVNASAKIYTIQVLSGGDLIDIDVVGA